LRPLLFHDSPIVYILEVNAVDFDTCARVLISLWL